MKRNKMKIVIFIFILIFLNCNQLFAKSIYIAKDSTPIEYYYIISSIQQVELSDLDQKEFDELIQIHDQLFSKLSKKEVFFLLKSEIFKSILSFTFKDSITRVNVDSTFVKKISDKIKENKDEYSPFSLWLNYSFLKDLQIILRDKEFVNIASTKTSKLKRQLNLIIPWLIKFETLPPGVYEKLISEIYMRVLKKISVYGQNFYRYSHFEKLEIILPITKFNHFRIQKLIAKQNDSNSIEKILEKPIDNSQDKAPQIKATTWQPKNDIFQHYPRPIPNYTPPSNLPSPVSNWTEETTTLFNINDYPKLFPTPDPKYVEPELIPSAVYNWKAPKEGNFQIKDFPDLFPLPEVNYIEPKALPKAVDKWD
jgi:hypothetical protein